MTISDRLTEDMKTSLRDGQSDRTTIIRLLRGSIKNEEIRLGHNLSEDEALVVLQKEAKQRRDSISAYEAASRPDLVEQENKELTVILAYLPEPMSSEEVSSLIDATIKQLSASDMKQMGAVVGSVMKQVGARAEGGLVSRLVREKLQS